MKQDRRFAVDEAGPHRRAFDSFDNPGKTISEVGAIAATRRRFAAQDAKAVVLDLVDPAGTGRRLFRRFW